jgi:hypothetical protein
MERGGSLIFKQFGAMRTGTNLVRLLVVENFGIKVLVNEGGSKHELPDFEKLDGLLMGTRPDFGFLISTKDPYAWLLSKCKFEAQRKDVGEFTPLILETLRHDLEAGEARDRVRGWLEDYNARYRVWFNMPAQDGRAIIRAEDLLTVEGQAEVVSAIGGIFELKPPDNLVTFTRRILPNGGRRGPFNAGFYQSGEYLAALPESAQRLIEEIVDWELFEPLGYGPLANEYS